MVVYQSLPNGSTSEIRSKPRRVLSVSKIVDGRKRLSDKKWKGVPGDHFHRTTICCSRGPDRPSYGGLFFHSDLSLNLGLGHAVLGPGPATAQYPDVCKGYRANCRGLPVTSYHLGKARSASLVAQLCALASRRAMVPGGRHRRRGSDLLVFCGCARGPCRFRRSGLELRTFMAEFVCLCPLPSSWWSAAGRRWVAWFRAAPFAAATRSFGRNRHPWDALGRVAPYPFLWANCELQPRC